MEPWSFRRAKDLGLSATERFRSTQRENGLLEMAFQVAWLSFVRVWMLIWHRLEIRGREHLPLETPYVLVANHASHLDALVLATVVPVQFMTRVVPIAAADVFFEKNALAAFTAVCANAFPIWRRRRMLGAHGLEELRERLLVDRFIYVLFPEGTRTRSGELQPFKSGLGVLVAGTSVPVVPCRLTGSFEAGPPGAIFPRPRKIIVDLGPPLCFGEVSNDHAGWQTVGNLAGDAIRQLGSPVRSVHQ
jgi:1-acyl-sn-glycerol-3-phosphate acyltransferase